MSEDGGGGEFREKLESALAEVRRLRIENLKANPKYALVEESDFAELKADQPIKDWETKAAEAHGARSETQTALLKKAGLSDEEIEAVLARASAPDEGEEEPSAEDAAAARVAAVAATQGGGRVPVTPDSKFTGAAAITEHFRRTEKKK